VYNPSSLLDLEPKDLPGKIDMVIGEPSFSASLLPWHNLLFWFSLQHVFPIEGFKELNEVRKTGDDVSTAPKICKLDRQFIMPKQARLWVVPVYYHDLWKIRAPLEIVEGFNMNEFDCLIMNACNKSDADVEPHPLWEYPCTAVGDPKSLMDFDFSTKVPTEKVVQRITLSLEKAHDLSSSCNGLALWTDWHLDENTVISDGPSEPINIGRDIVWYTHAKQGVFLLSHLKNDSTIQCNNEISLEMIFDPNEGDLKFAIK